MGCDAFRYFTTLLVPVDGRVVPSDDGSCGVAVAEQIPSIVESVRDIRDEFPAASSFESPECGTTVEDDRSFRSDCGGDISKVGNALHATREQ